MGSSMNCQPVHRVFGLGRMASCSAAWSGIWGVSWQSKDDRNRAYVVRDENPLVVVGELPEVGGGGVPALGGAEGDVATGASINIALDSAHHRVFSCPSCTNSFSSNSWPWRLIVINGKIQLAQNNSAGWCRSAGIENVTWTIIFRNWTEFKPLFLIVNVVISTHMFFRKF